MTRLHPYIAALAATILLVACMPRHGPAAADAENQTSASPAPEAAVQSEPPPTFTIDTTAGPTDMDRGGRCLMILWRKGSSEAASLFVAYAPHPMIPTAPSGGYLRIDGKPIYVEATDAAYTGPIGHPESLAPNFRSRDDAIEVYVDARVVGVYGGNQHSLAGALTVRYHNENQDVDMEGRLTC